MSYQVIARKYRPQRFSDVVGQDHVTQTLANAISQNRIAHAYLFVGPRGTGKTTIARIFAKCLNATDGPTVDYTDDDPLCQEITEGRSLDVLEIDGASNRGIDEVRELRETVKYAPANGRFKIYIIDEVHMLTKEAFNALLKTLEEPPSHVKFMFATTEPEKVLATILSRCQRFDLRRIPVSLITQHLTHIAKQEKVSVDDNALNAIARGADGGMRDAESALDQLISFCGNKIVESDVLSMFGLTAQGQIRDLSRAILDGQAEVVLREVTHLAQQGKDFGRLIGDLLNHFRNLLIFSVSRGDLNLLETSETEAASLTEQSSLVTEDSLTRIMEVLSDAEAKLRNTASKKIFIEVTLLKTIQARNAISVDTLLTQLKDLSSQSATPGNQPRQSPDPQAPSSRTRQSSAPKAPSSRTRQGSAPQAPSSRTRQGSDPQAPSSRTRQGSDPQAPSSRTRQSSEPSTPAGTIKTAAATNTIEATQAPAIQQPSSPASIPSTKEALWENLLRAVGEASAFTRSYLLVAHPVALDDKYFTIGFDPDTSDQLELVNNQKTIGLLQSKLEELGKPVHVKFVTAESPNPKPQPEPEPEIAPPTTQRPAKSEPSQPPPAQAAPPQAQSEAAKPKPKRPKPAAKAISTEEFKDDPLIKRALELFKGQIVDVRT